MGIKNLLKFLYNYPNIIKNKNRDELYGKKIAIDISILLYQSVISIRNSGSDIITKNGQIISHIVGLLNKTILLINNNIIPIFVFDGRPPTIKRSILNIRRELKTKALLQYDQAENKVDQIKYFKRCVSITKDNINDCRELLSLMGIPYIDAPQEADSELAYLCKNNLVYAVLTEDMDILTFGSHRIIKNILCFNKPLIEINLTDILSTLNINYEEFVELCIFFGCDYCIHPIKNINMSNQQIYEVFKKNKFEILNKLNININDYIIAKKYFINCPNNNIKESLELKPPQIDKLIDLLVNKYNLSYNKVISKINKLTLFYNMYKQN
jgi:flap endonuclease-1